MVVSSSQTGLLHNYVTSAISNAVAQTIRGLIAIFEV